MKSGIIIPHFFGKNYNDHMDSESNNTKFKFGYTGGIFCELEIARFFSLTPGIYFSMSGGNYGNDNYKKNNIKNIHRAGYYKQLW